MKELTTSDVVRIKDLDSKIKNKFRFMWLEDGLTIKSKKGDSITICVGGSIVKVDIPGKVLCKFCNDVINYGSKGRVAIIDHLKSGKHASDVDHRKSNYTLGAQKNAPPALFPLFKLPPSPPKQFSSFFTFPHYEH